MVVDHVLVLGNFNLLHFYKTEYKFWIEKLFNCYFERFFKLSKLKETANSSDRPHSATMEHPPTPLSKLVSDWGWLSTVDSAEPEHGFANGLDSSPRWPWSRWHTRSWDLSPRGAAGEQTWRKEELVQEVTATPRPRIHSWQGRCHCEVARLRPTYW